MLTTTYRNLIVQFVIFLMIGLISCHSQTADQKTDAVTKLMIHYLNTNKPDSAYQLTDQKFREHITPILWASAYKEILPALLPLTNVTFITSNDSVSIYKIDGKIPLNCYISLDKQQKIYKFYFTPYQEEIKQVAMSESEKKTDALAQKILGLINRKQTDSVYLFAGDYYKSKESLTKWREFARLIYAVTPLPPAIFLKSDQGMNYYSMKSYLFVFGALDKTGKFNAFGIKLHADSTIKTLKTPGDNKLFTHLDSVVDKNISPYIQTKGNVGVSVGIFYQGKNYFYNYGERKQGIKNLPDQHTLYDIGSITKTFTATLLAIAVDQGKVTLETSITKFLPDSIATNPDLKKITFKELANHTSGFPREGKNFEKSITDINQPFGNYAVNDMFSYLKHFKQTREPGTTYEYSNFAVGLLGVLLEKIYHQSYPDLISQYITTPLKMNETACEVDTIKFKDVAQGYGELLTPVPFIKLKAIQSAGVIKSSTFDLITYAKSQISSSNPTLNTALKLTHQITYNNGTYSLGLIWNYTPADNMLRHNGATVGYRSFMCVDLGKQAAVIILTNNATASDEMAVSLIKAIESKN